MQFLQMLKSIFSEGVLKCLAVIALGACGSALWEFARPVLGHTGNLLIQVSSLGIDSLTDGLYTKAALAFALADESSQYVFLGAIFGVLIAIYIEVSWQEEIMAKTKDMLYCILLVGMTRIAWQAARTAFTYRLARDTKKIFITASPYLSEMDRLGIRSRMVRCSGRTEFLREVDQLKVVLEKNAIEVKTLSLSILSN